MDELIPATVAGIPCTLRVDSYISVPAWKGSAQTCPSSDDYYGYTEMEYTVCDRRGRPAPWLAVKVTPTTHLELKTVIDEYMSNKEEAF